MASVNKAIIIGNLGADPELRSTQAGTAVCELRIATNRKYKTRDGEAREETEWHRVIAWDRQAETCAKYLSKGRQVFVEGRLQTRKWEDKEGNNRYTTEIVAQTVQFLSGSGGGAAGGADVNDIPLPPAKDKAPAPNSDGDDLPF